ncbi:cell division protein FtsI/penicillin-binding protein 2 [Microbacterium amylolyticum]|uniref:Cell division protein FtsI/penicillin-binding protein 2 n=2 Tax=Microbacterium amylolyticum TaxID=936337 RepID=A0ABS4ZK45_9MICO|nr:cell division protein FtsI/penicillin-binding protein 2 [Microbacterium amylolyticum]
MTKMLRATALLTVSALGLAACSAGDDGLDDAVSSLETALESRVLETYPEFADVIEPLAEFPLTVTAGEVERGDDDDATVPLTWVWDIDGHEWTYETAATLRFDSDAEVWSVDADPALIADDLTADESLAVSYVAPDRAEIIGADEEVLVTERPVGRYGLDKSWIDDDHVAESAAAVAEAVDIDVDDFVARAENMGDMAFVEAIVLRPHDAEERVANDFLEIPGANVIETTMMLAPTSSFAREILGVVGEATAEIIDGSDGEIRTGDIVGLSGLQARYDEDLRGARGITIAAVVDDEDAEPRVLAEWDATPADPLQITLNSGLQQWAESVLGGTGSASALVVIDPATGDILAAANRETGGFDAATSGRYAPGSTYKVVTALALLRSGLSPDDTVTCSPELTVDGYTFHNHDGYPADALGEITLREAIAQSCNTALIGERDRISDADLREAAEALGIAGPDDATSETQRAANLIGQGVVTATPREMATVAASVAGGRTVSSHILADSAEQPASTLSEQEAAQLHELMRTAVTEGSANLLAHLDPPVSAKTGTAEHGEPGEDGQLPTHAWMIGFSEGMAVAVFVEEGESGSSVAGPLMEAFFAGA